MGFGKYRAFAAAAELQSLTRAADALGYTQSGVSHLVATLEEELGLSLLVRSRAGVHLTQEGAALLPLVQRLLRQEQDIRTTAEDLRGVKSGTLRVGVFSSIALSFLPRLLRSFQEQYPAISVQVENDTYSAIERDLAEERLDCAFVALPSRSEFTVTPLMQDRLLVVVGSGSPLAARETLSVPEIADVPFILPAEGRDYSIGQVFDAAGVSPNVIFDMRDDFAALAMVRQGLGITILPELMLQGLPQDGICAIPLHGGRREIGIAVNRSRESPLIHAFLATVQAALAPSPERVPSPVRERN